LGHRGERVELVDRRECIALVEEAAIAGASRAASCEILELSVRTLERWKKDPEKSDERAGPLTPAPHQLTEAERKMIKEVSNSAPCKDLNPWKIVAKLADLGVYMASESSFYRVLRESNLLNHRSKSSPRIVQPPKDLIAVKPNQVWSWDITYLLSIIKGRYFYLYLMMDVYSRYIVGWRVEEVESMEYSADLMTTACHRESIAAWTLTLHADNGGPMKGATMLATMQKLHVVPSFSRPSVSDDNPFSESLFKTLKYCPAYPEKPFENIESARTWVEKFVTWYNTEHLHSGIKFVTPKSRHDGKDEEILNNRHQVYQKAKAANPLRWSRQTRNWSIIKTVRLNPGKETKIEIEKLRNQAA
jgi:putative transposase